MADESEAKKQIEYQGNATGCGAESTFGGWRAGEDQQQAFGKTRLGRLVLKLQSLVERLVTR